ncbi:MAG: ArnT family glycosyltransferase [Chloroflexota bacterium]
MTTHSRRASPYPGARGTHSLDRRSVAALTLTLLAYATLAFGYVTLTPIWQNPDEPAHYNYVAYVAETGGLPTLQSGDWDSALLERLKNGRLQPGDSVSAIRYEAWQPPLFYLAAAPLFRVGPMDDPSVLVFRLRAFNAALGALTICLAYLVAREILPRHLAVAVPLVLVGIPMFTSVSAAISTDPLANLLAAGIVLVLVRGFWSSVAARRNPVDAKRAIGVGALIGLGLLTKLALGIFVPVALLALLCRSSRPIRQAGLMLGAVSVVVLPWMIHQVTSYGWGDPLATSRHAAVVLDQPRFPGLSLPFVGSFLTTTFHSFWAQFGWMGVVAPERLYWIWGLMVGVAVVGLALEHRRLYAEPAWLLLLGTLAAAVLGYIAYNLTFQQPQGRYLFTALVPIAMLLVVGWAAWLPQRVQGWGIVLVGVGLVGLNTYALLRVLVPGFASTG